MHSDMMAAKTRIPRTVHRNRFELASWGVWLERMINRKRMNSFLRFTHVQESTIQRQNEIDRFRPADQRLIDGLPSVGQMERLAVGSSDFRFQIWDLGFGIFFGAWERLHLLRTAYRILPPGRLHLRFITHSVKDSQGNYHDSNHPKYG